MQEIKIRRIQKISTANKFEENSKGEMELVSQFKFEAVIDPDDLASIHRLGRSGSPLEITIQTCQSSFIDTQTGEIMPAMS